MEEIETSLCIKKIQNQSAEVALPRSIIPGVDAQVVFDNIDHLEETESGSGTSHRVNGIIIQKRVFGPLPYSGQQVERTKRKSLPLADTTLNDYIKTPRKGPSQPYEATQQDYSAPLNTSKLLNLHWCITRFYQEGIPSWTGYNILTKLKDIVHKDNVGYLPPIDSPATQMNTASEIMRRTLKIMNDLGLSFIFCTCDQALYAKLYEVKWKEAIYSSIFLRMGDFHSACNFCGTIGRQFWGSGLNELAVETGIVAEGSVNSVLEGRHYNRAIRFHKLVYEALLQLAWQQFILHYEHKFPDSSQRLDNVVSLFQQTTVDSNSDLLENADVKIITNLFLDYLQMLRDGQQGELQQFWMSYLDMVDVLLGLIRASRESNLELHLACIEEICHWLFAYDKTNYSRYLPVYWLDMQKIVSTNEEAREFLSAGGLSVQLSNTNPFGRIPPDQTIEETANKDTQTAKGIRHFSLNANKVNRHFLSAEYRSTALHLLRHYTLQKQDVVNHTDLNQPRIERDNTAVKSIKTLLEESWINPMNPENDTLVSIATGRVATTEVKNDLMKAKELGKSNFKSFCEERLQSEELHKSFFDKLPKLKLKTFASLQTKHKISMSKGKEIILKPKSV